MAGWPVVGRLLRIGVAVIRLPEFRAEYLARHGLSDAALLPDAQGRHSLFETEQLPTLLQTVSALNHRQLASDNDRDNLVKSVPVALRRLGRDLAAGRAELQRIEQSFAQQLGATAQQLEHQARAQLGEVAASLGQQLDGMTADTGAHIGALNARLDGAAHTVEFLLGRVEFVRRELMFEMRYGASTPAAGADKLEMAGEILAPEKVAAARQEGLRLNLGCGHIALDGYLNVDRRALPGVDIVAEVDRLPFVQGELTEIFSAHLLEHFPQEQLRRALLPYYFGLLRANGRFAAVVPDAEAMMREYANGTYPYAHLREVLYGGQDYDGDFHFNMFTPESMSEYLREAGFVDVQVLASGRRNGHCYEFEIAARKPARHTMEQAA
jgi:predicted SAM-dependent methyltransferase